MLTYLQIILTARVARRSERGASAVEYGLLVAGVALGFIGIIQAFFWVLAHVFVQSCNEIASDGCIATP